MDYKLVGVSSENDVLITNVEMVTKSGAKKELQIKHLRPISDLEVKSKIQTRLSNEQDFIDAVERIEVIKTNLSKDIGKNITISDRLD